MAEVGIHSLKARVQGVTPQDEDVSNQELQTTVQVGEFSDYQLPLVFITEPYQNAVVSGLVVVKGTASDNNVVDYVEVRVLPNIWEKANGYQNWAWAWNSSQDLNGRYTIEARSFDGFNFSEILFVDGTVLFTIDIQAMNILLAVVETESAKYNINLSSKTCFIPKYLFTTFFKIP